jgi:hypothetical protein
LRARQHGHAVLRKFNVRIGNCGHKSALWRRTWLSGYFTPLGFNGVGFDRLLARDGTDWFPLRYCAGTICRRALKEPTAIPASHVRRIFMGGSYWITPEGRVETVSLIGDCPYWSHEEWCQQKLHKDLDHVLALGWVRIRAIPGNSLLIDYQRPWITPRADLFAPNPLGSGHCGRRLPVHRLRSRGRLRTSICRKRPRVLGDSW